jgi:hypothetical protein
MGPEDSRLDEESVKMRGGGEAKGSDLRASDRSLLCAHYEPYIPRPNVIRVSLLPKSRLIQEPMTDFRGRPAHVLCGRDQVNDR